WALLLPNRDRHRLQLRCGRQAAPPGQPRNPPSRDPSGALRMFGRQTIRLDVAGSPRFVQTASVRMRFFQWEATNQTKATTMTSSTATWKRWKMALKRGSVFQVAPNF